MEEGHFVATVSEDLVTTCWGCGLQFSLPSPASFFKCGWCGAITKQDPLKFESNYSQWRRLRDRFFVSILILFMLFVMCGGIWAVYPVIFSLSLFYGGLHCVIIVILSVSTSLNFSLAACKCAGTPPNISWGSYPAVGKGDLENFTFCQYCSKPKAPRTHHCRSCRMCIVDMDHHCPFIGNCVGAANHQYFVFFLASAMAGMVYVVVISVYASIRLWPPLSSGPLGDSQNGFGGMANPTTVKEAVVAVLSSAVVLPARSLLLVYLFFASASVNIGLSVLLWQQLRFIYAGKTYLGELSSGGECGNLFLFFGCRRFAVRFFQGVRALSKKHSK